MRSGYFGGKLIISEVENCRNRNIKVWICWIGIRTAQEETRSSAFPPFSSWRIWNALRSAVRPPPLTASAALLQDGGSASIHFLLMCLSTFIVSAALRAADRQPSLQVCLLPSRLYLTAVKGDVLGGVLLCFSTFFLSLRADPIQRWMWSSITDVELSLSQRTTFLPCLPAKTDPLSDIKANYYPRWFTDELYRARLVASKGWSRLGFVLRRLDLCKVGELKRTRLGRLRWQRQQVLQTLRVDSHFHAGAWFYRVGKVEGFRTGSCSTFIWIWLSIGFFNLNWTAPGNVSRRRSVWFVS